MVLYRRKLPKACLFGLSVSVFVVIGLELLYLLQATPPDDQQPELVTSSSFTKNDPVVLLHTEGLLRHIVQRQIAEETTNRRETTQLAEETTQPPPVDNDAAEPSGLDAKKRDKVVEMIKHAWTGYEKYAWGKNELRPVSKTGYSPQIFGCETFGATIVDSLDTLFIAGFVEEYQKARQWVVDNFTFEGPCSISVFEINIRFVGGFLSAYALTKDEVFLKQATLVARKLLPAFDTTTGISYSSFNLNGLGGNNWDALGCSVLSEFGTLSMEFAYLSELTGDTVFRDKIQKIYSHLKNIQKTDGLYRNFLHPETGIWCVNDTSVGSFGDSFYEYLLKTWLQTNHYEVEMKAAYDDAIAAIFRKLMQTTAKGHVYLAEMQSGELIPKMSHLACYICGLIGLSAKHSPHNETEYMRIADAIGETCHASYNLTVTGIGPDVFYFFNEQLILQPGDNPYYLRPEVIESYFYMWRLTHDQKWRNYGWEAVQAIEEHCRTEAGYSGLANVDLLPARLDDIQQSFFLAETLKYLYLLFSPDHVIPLDQWVFNTEAHPLPIFTPTVSANNDKEKTNPK